MALPVKDAYLTVFEIKEENGRVSGNVSSSRKGMKENERLYSSWKVSFVGKAKEQAKTLQEKDRILVKGAQLTNEPYVDSNNQKKYFVRLTVFEFDQLDSKYQKSTPKQKPSTPKNFEVVDEDLPF